MFDNPLLPPLGDSRLLHEYLRANQIDPAQERQALLVDVACAFARLPFENLTKIIKEAEAGRAEEARRPPAEVLSDHAVYGAGGTCFALTATLLHLVRALGFDAEPILADRRYGADTHSGLLVWIDGKPHLLDPGYLIVNPLPIPTDTDVVVPTPFNELILRPTHGGAAVELHTVQDGRTTYRLTFKPKPVDAGEFLRAWDISFDAEMMRYPVLSRVVGDQQLYLQKKHLLVRGKDQTITTEVPPDQLIDEIARRFHMAPALVARALRVLQKK
ncbi:MAG: arylamine N-acetyltransferase [Planctomycetes bacterium]|nr:arylamine N-acetyltransferase [Planctomycetota bacterium]